MFPLALCCYLNCSHSCDAVCTVSGIHELKFTVVDSDWYEKKEAIASLDVKYKALWNSLLE